MSLAGITVFVSLKDDVVGLLRSRSHQPNLTVVFFELEILTQLAVERRHDDIRGTRKFTKQSDKLSGFQFFLLFLLHRLTRCGIAISSIIRISCSPSFHPRGSEGFFCIIRQSTPRPLRLSTAGFSSSCGKQCRQKSLSDPP